MLPKKEWQKRFKKALLKQLPMKRAVLRIIAHFALDARKHHASPEEAANDWLEVRNIIVDSGKFEFNDLRDLRN